MTGEALRLDRAPPGHGDARIHAAQLVLGQPPPNGEVDGLCSLTAKADVALGALVPGAALGIRKSFEDDAVRQPRVDRADLRTTASSGAIRVSAFSATSS